MFLLQRRKNKDIIQENLDHSILAVDICNHHGIGAKLVWALEIMLHCHLNNLEPRFRFTYPRNGVEHFQPFFSIKLDGRKSRSLRYARVRNVEDLHLGKYYGAELSIDLAHTLVNKFLSINAGICNEVDLYCQEYFNSPRVLGVHYRGTDKKAEAPAVAYDAVIRNINHYISKYPDTVQVFISTDDQNFVDFAEGAEVQRPILLRKDFVRSRDLTPTHHSHRHNINMNRDAVINCLILSRCTALLKTASILSAWSKILNPSLPVVMLNQPYPSHSWFPEKELARSVLYDPIA